MLVVWIICERTFSYLRGVMSHGKSWELRIGLETQVDGRPARFTITRILDWILEGA